MPISGRAPSGPGPITGYGLAGLLRTRDCRVRKSLSRALCGRLHSGDRSHLTQPLCAAIASPASVHYTVCLTAAYHPLLCNSPSILDSVGEQAHSGLVLAYGLHRALQTYRGPRCFQSRCTVHPYRNTRQTYHTTRRLLPNRTDMAARTTL